MPCLQSSVRAAICTLQVGRYHEFVQITSRCGRMMHMSLTISTEIATTTMGERITMLLFRRKLTKAAVGRIVGLSREQVSRKINGKSPWYFEELAAVAHALDTSIAFLAGETDNPQPLNAKVPASFETGTDDVVAGTGFEPATSGL